MRFSRTFVALAAAGSLAGCGSVIYTVSVNAAERAVQDAQEAGSATLAPYEYYTAAEHLRKAKEEAAEASYEDAIRFAETAEAQGTKARELARHRRPGAGR